MKGVVRRRGESYTTAEMGIIRYTPYFENQVLRKRPYLQKRWCARVIRNPIRAESQENDRIRFWGSIPELPGYYLRVVTLADGLTVHNAFFDRRFRP